MCRNFDSQPCAYYLFLRLKNTRMQRSPPPKIININYTEDQAGQDILDQDVIRAVNGRFYTEEEVRNFRLRSRPRCPTYGNCNRCFATGPVGKVCGFCPPQHGAGYVVVSVGCMRTRTKPIILDAENLATQMPNNHEVARADRTYSWKRTPSESIEFAVFHQIMNGVLPEAYLNELAVLLGLEHP